jgi:cell wall assembly regulator SMI1
MEDIWRLIEAWIAVHAPAIRFELLPGASDDDVQSAEKSLGVKLPDDVRSSYLLHNGQSDIGTPLLGEWLLLSLEYVVSQWESLTQILTAGRLAKVNGRSTGVVRREWWDPKWIPVAYNGAGDFYCVDLNPTPRGTLGQVISFWHTRDEREQIALSFRDWLQGFANDLEAGKYVVEDDSLVIAHQEP